MNSLQHTCNIRIKLFAIFLLIQSQFCHDISFSNNHGQKLLRHMKITNLFYCCKFCSLPSRKVASPSPFFNV